MELSDRIAIVTGAASGIGRGIALVLAERGADIVAADLDEEAAAGLVPDIEALGRSALSVRADVTDRASMDAMTRAAVDRFGRIDILVNNAGVGGAPGWWERTQSSPEDWEAAYAVNVRGIVNATNSVRDHMQERRAGKIVNISSGAGRRGAGGFAHYSASKAAAINVSQGLALQLAPFNINVNCICPGLIWTPLWENLALRVRDQRAEHGLSPREVFLSRVRESTPLGREQTAEDVGRLAAFLCSDRAKNITGQSVNLNGGSYMN
ncbi:MAG: SDR family NAD(P)-dependent oxidoreductase [Dehalococcoidia bacterium]